MNLRKLFLFSTICGMSLLASCSSSNSLDNEAELATQVADGTLPPWLAESGDNGGYTAVSNNKPSSTYVVTKATKNSSVKSSKGKSSSKATPTKSGKSKSSRAKSSKSKSSSPKYYTVKKGDSVEKIARKYGTTSSKLMKTNNMKSDLIITGKKLRLP